MLRNEILSHLPLTPIRVVAHAATYLGLTIARDRRRKIHEIGDRIGAMGIGLNIIAQEESFNRRMQTLKRERR